MSARNASPIVLAPNQPPGRPYRGGAGIARFRGIAVESPEPEDFVGSATEVWSGGGIGLTMLNDGRTLRDAVITDPMHYFGPRHAQRFGSDTLLLVKLLNTGERLFAHFHPDDDFAARNFNSPHGKTEAWIVIDVEEDADPYALLGFARDVTTDEVHRWFREQRRSDILDAMNRVHLSVGDTLLVPARVPHAIGPGVTLLELQQPTDLSILIEYEGYGDLTPEDALLGLVPDVAFAGLSRVPFDVRAHHRPTTCEGARVVELFPPAAREFFRAWWIGSPTRVRAGFAILVVVRGEGALVSAEESLPLFRGMTVLIPYAAGELDITGDIGAVLCAPPTRETL